MHERTGNNHLRTHRKRLAFSQTDLSRLLGHQTSSSIIRWEAGQRSPSLAALMALEFLLGVPIRALFPSLWQQVGQMLRAHVTQFHTELALQRATPLALYRRGNLEHILERLAPDHVPP